jgi:uncharacterized membrane protein
MFNKELAIVCLILTLLGWCIMVYGYGLITVWQCADFVCEGKGSLCTFILFLASIAISLLIVYGIYKIFKKLAKGL